jgi:hypothetical protein
VCRLRPSDLGDRRDDHARQQAVVDKWFWAAFLMASNGISALQLQSQLGLGSYRTAWMLCAKLRRAMVNPQREPLCGLVEADETIIPFRTKEDPIVLPAGRSGVGKMLVAGAVEVDSGAPRRARLKVIEGFGEKQPMSGRGKDLPRSPFPARRDDSVCPVPIMSSTITAMRPSIPATKSSAPTK